ncbi:hypothetical protein B0A50_08074 [Salinomyces thailandicus]|uniref:Uncharacterized protein n=1 Tax=Salinomyces thailandicus TaxID=706561 RepID=A0A4U0TKU8_9PEZI|nr:hypothetical protein B0A50_08074 [Salinomyces thailandica]
MRKYSLWRIDPALKTVANAADFLKIIDGDYLSSISIFDPQGGNATSQDLEVRTPIRWMLIIVPLAFLIIAYVALLVAGVATDAYGVEIWDPLTIMFYWTGSSRARVGAALRSQSLDRSFFEALCLLGAPRCTVQAFHRFHDLKELPAPLEPSTRTIISIGKKGRNV